MKQLRWQILVVLVTLVIVAVLLFSTQSPAIGNVIQSQPEQGGVFTEGLVGSLGRLNPLLDWNNSADRDINHLLFSGLIHFDERGLPQADLAESWGSTPDGTVYNFAIRPNAIWHDGTPVTSDDVIFTIDMMKSAGSLYPQDIKDLWSNKVTVTKLNDKNIKFTLTEPFVPFLDYLTFGVVPKHLLESVPPDQMASAEFNIKPIGTGPYKFDRLLVENGQIIGVVLTVFDGYYRTAAFVEQVVFRYYPTSAAAFAAYKQGDVFSVSQITPDVLGEALAEPNLNTYTSPMPQMGFVLFNLNSPDVAFLQDAKVRRALMLGLNRSYIINQFLGGQAVLADGPVLPNSWAHYDGIEKIDYDPDAAISLLKTEGYVIPAVGGDVRAKDSVSLTFTLSHPDDALHTQIAQAIQTEWAQIGVRVNLQAVPYDKLVLDTLASRAYQAALVDLNLSRTPDPDPYPFWHQAEATGGQNYSQWNNRAASEYLEQARVTADSTMRARLYRNFQIVFAKELPSLPLYVPVYTYGVDSQVQGVQVGALYDPSDRFTTFTSWYLLTRRALEQPIITTSTP